jgi:murein DD-endopeptidase MepM/ murein hydrolase activator NlpD
MLRAAAAVVVLLAVAGQVGPAPEPPEPAPEPDPLEGLPPAEAVAYAPPVDAAVADPFRAPEHPYGPGNRGIEYETAGGEAVRAAAPGEVIFAGSVAGDRYVTVLHADRLRTTYGRLAAVEVAVGALVEAGDLLGRAGPAFIWTARLGDAYLDPAILVEASGARRAWLVPDGTTP